jgi:hypothetical protein
MSMEDARRVVALEQRIAALERKLDAAVDLLSDLAAQAGAAGVGPKQPSRSSKEAKAA